MITDEQLRDLNNKVYQVDTDYKKDGKDTTSIKKGAKIKTGDQQSFIVLDVKEDGGLWGTGFQGMAVAPITEAYPNGDPTQVVVIAAGTDPNKANDLLNAGKSLIGLDSDQLSVANDFINEVKKKYPIAQLSGYSQSAYMLSAGAEHGIPTTVFNGWFRYNRLTPKQAKFMSEHPDWFHNYRRKDDDIVQYLDGNLPNGWYDEDGQFHKIDTYDTIIWTEGKDHGLAAWKFENGMLVEVEISAKDKMAYIEKSMKSQLNSLDFLKNKLKDSGGKLSSTEEIYLDSAETLVIAEGVLTTINAGFLDIIKEYKDGIEDIEELWSMTQTSARGIGSRLTESEMLEALVIGDASQTTIVNEPKDYYERKKSEADSIKIDYQSLVAEIQTAISRMLETDQALAKQVFQ